MLLLTNNQDLFYILNMQMLEKSADNKCITCDFQSKNIQAHIKDFEELGACVIYNSKSDDFPEQTISSLAGICGYLTALRIPVYTNIPFLTTYSLFSSNVISVANRDQLMEKMDSDYESLNKGENYRKAKADLFTKGIPFTADCFGQYIAKNKLEIVQTFLTGGMSVNSKDDTGTPMLNIACRTDNFEFVEMLLNLGADINALSEDRGYTAVMDAVWRGNEKITRYLIEKGAELNTINKEGQTNLILAVGANKENIVRILAENGADPDIKDGMGMSAYTYATLFNQKKLVDILAPYHKD